MVFRPFIAGLGFCIGPGFGTGLRALFVTFSASLGVRFRHNLPRHGIQKAVSGMFAAVMDHVGLAEYEFVIGMQGTCLSCPSRLAPLLPF